MDPLIDDFRVETVIRCGLGRGGGMKETHTANDTAPARNPRLWTLVVAVGYIAAWIGLWFVSRQLNLTTGISLWYPPAGLTFAILLGCGGWALPLPVLASLLAGLSIWSWAQWPYYLAANLLPPLGYLIAAHALRRYSDEHRYEPWHFKDTQRMAAFLGVTAAASLFAALSGTYLLDVAELLPAGSPLLRNALGWWVGDFVGIVTFAPLLLIFVAPRIRCLCKSEPARSFRSVSLANDPLSARLLLLQILLSVVLLVALFWAPHLWQDLADPFMTLLLLPVLVWIVATRSIRGAVLAVFLFELGIVTMVIVFGRTELAIQYQVVMATVAVCGLITGAVSHERLANTILFRGLAEISNDLLWEFDADGKLRSLRGPFAKAAKTGADPVGANWLSFIISQERDTDLALLKIAIQQRQPFRQLILLMWLPGQDHSAWTRNSGLPLFDEDGAFLGYRGTTTDISEQKKTEVLHKKAEALLRNYDQVLEAKVEAKVEERTRQLAEASLRNWQLANYDSLTSLPNRNLLFEHLRKGLQQARRQWRLLAVLLVDLDGFKQVNDTLGHDAGDELLRQVAMRLKQCVRATDTPARLGGDEFTLVLPDLERPETAAAVAQKIVTRLAEPIMLNSTSVTITASIGIAVYRPELSANLEMAMSLLRQADSAMYAAKRAGKNSWRIAEQLDLN